MDEQLSGPRPFKFECPHCGQHLSATPDMFGTERDCPACCLQFTVPPFTTTQVGSESESALDRPDVFVHHDGEQSGPYSKKQVGEFCRQGTFKTDDLVWTQGMPDWLPLRRYLPEAFSENAKPTDVLPESANYFVRHWRGDLSLGVSYWVNGLLGTFAVALAAKMLGAMGDTINLKLIAAMSLFVYATAVVVSVWQLVGIWRSATNHAGTVWPSLAKVAVVIGVLRCILVIYRTYIPQSAEMVSIISGDTRMPPFAIRVLSGGTEVEFRGGLRVGCAKKLEEFLASVPQAKVLHIESPGGRINEAKKMIQLVHEHALITYTSEQCLSAAPLVLLAGKERVVAEGAKVGFHAGRLPGATAAQQAYMDNEVRSTMESAGVSEGFITRVLATPPDKMWYPTFSEMLEAHVVTSQSHGDRFSTSWGSSDAAIRKIGASPGFSAIREFEPETYSRLIAAFSKAIQSGKSETEAISTISGSAAGLVTKYLPMASDAAVLSILRDEWIAMLSKYKDKNSRECVAVFTGAQINPQRAFPHWDGATSLRLLDNVIRSGASKTTVSLDKKAAVEDLQTVFKTLKAKYGSDLPVLRKPDQWGNNSQKVCDMLLAMYQQIAALPDHRAANLVRYLVGSKENATSPAITPTQPNALPVEQETPLP